MISLWALEKKILWGLVWLVLLKQRVCEELAVPTGSQAEGPALEALPPGNNKPVLSEVPQPR